MNNIKIACPACGQHIACDETWAGRQIACPTCQHPLVIPSSTSPAPPAVQNVSLAESTQAPIPPPPTSRAPSAPTAVPRPVPVPVPRPGPAGRPGKTSGLAIASLAFSLGTCILGPLGSLPGIVLGHMAKSRIRRDTSLRGSGVATTGLVIGYLFGVLWGIWFAIFGLAWITAARHSTNSPPPIRPITPTIPSQGVNPGNPKPYVMAPKAKPQLEMPPDAVAGKIGSHQFQCDSATLEKGGLILRQGIDAVTAEITVTSFGSDYQTLGGKTISVLPRTRGPVPQVNVLWHENGRTENLVQKRDYTMALRFDAFTDGTVNGHIDLLLPGKPGVLVKGNFIARVK